MLNPCSTASPLLPHIFLSLSWSDSRQVPFAASVVSLDDPTGRQGPAAHHRFPHPPLKTTKEFTLAADYHQAASGLVCNTCSGLGRGGQGGDKCERQDVSGRRELRGAPEADWHTEEGRVQWVFKEPINLYLRGESLLNMAENWIGVKCVRDKSSSKRNEMLDVLRNAGSYLNCLGKSAAKDRMVAKFSVKTAQRFIFSLSSPWVVLFFY